jgi:hypothetical protein
LKTAIILPPIWAVLFYVRYNISMSEIPQPRPNSEMVPSLHLVEAPSATLEDYQVQVEDIAATLARPGVKQQNIELAWETYVMDEENPNLAQFAAIMISAHNYYQYDAGLSELTKQPSHLQIPEQKSRRDEYKYMLCQFNHQIRDFILAHGDQVPRDKFEAWMAKCGQVPEQWANSRIAGVISEIGVYMALLDEPSLINLRFGSVEEDLLGKDMLAETSSRQMIQIDVKSGTHEPVTKKIPDGIKLEISLRHQLLSGYRLNPDAEKGVRFLVDLALKQSQSHKHYHKPRTAAV